MRLLTAQVDVRIRSDHGFSVLAGKRGQDQV